MASLVKLIAKMFFRKNLPAKQKALAIFMWLVLFCVSLGAVSTPLPSQGSNVTAGNDATLIANDKINIVAARNTDMSAHKEKSSSASVGVGVSIGQQTGFGIDLAGSGAKGHRIEADQSWTYSHVKAGNTTTLISGGDTNIIGGQVIGNRVQAEIGGDLNIQSLQNTSKGEAKDKSTGASISIGWGTYTSIGEGIASAAASANQSKANANGEYASVVEYAGIMAGSGGFQVNVKGNTDLKGAIISSTQAAIDQGKNELTTGSLTTSDILNFNKSESEGSSIGFGVSKGGKDADGQEKGFSASPSLPLSGKKDDEEYSLTLSGISGGKITITDEGKQLQLTGQTAAEAIDGINTNVLTGMATGGLIKDWDVEKQLKEMQANIDITKEFVQEGGQFVSSLGIQEKLKKDEAEKKLNDPSLNLTPEEKANYQAIVDGKTLWQMGDSGRLVATSLLAALSGNVSGSNADILQGAAINAIQGLGAQQIKALIDGLSEDKTVAGEGMRTALHALLACGGAAAQGGSCSAGALGAGSAVVVGNLIEKLKNTDVTKLTPEEKEAHLNLVNTIVGAITLGVGEDVQVAIAAATIEMENNQLKTSQTQDEIWEFIDGDTGKPSNPNQGMYEGAKYISDTGRQVVAVADGIFEVVLDEVTDPLNYIPGGAIVSVGGKVFKVGKKITSKLCPWCKPKVELIETAAGAGKPVLMIGNKKGSVTGQPTVIGSKANAEEIRSLKRENESPNILKKFGYDVEQNPVPKLNGKRPDYKIHGEYYDNYAPTTDNVRSISERAAEKVSSGQTNRVVINLADSNVSLDALYKQFNNYPVTGLEHVIVIDKEQRLYHLYQKAK